MDKKTDSPSKPLAQRPVAPVKPGGPPTAPPPPRTGVLRPAAGSVPPPTFGGSPKKPAVTPMGSVSGPVAPEDTSVPKVVRVEEEQAGPLPISKLDAATHSSLVEKTKEYWERVAKASEGVGFEAAYQGDNDMRFNWSKWFVGDFVTGRPGVFKLGFTTALGVATELLKKYSLEPDTTLLVHAWEVVRSHVGQGTGANQGGTGFGGNPPENPAS